MRLTIPNWCRMPLPLLLCCCALACIASCKSDLTVLEPSFAASESLIGKMKPLPDSVKARINGVYTTDQAVGAFGEKVVVRFDGDHLSMFCGRNVAYIVTTCGRVDSTIVMEGYWRYGQASTTGLIRLVIGPNDGARELLTKSTRPAKIVMRGLKGEANQDLSTPVVFSFNRAFKPSADSFLVVGHRGGGRNSDGLPVSENSVEIIKMAGRLGCNGVEIDIRLTSDGVPVLFHDENLSTRLVKGEYVVGPVGNYSFAQLRRYCKLINGEDIPTLVEILDAVLASNLKFVWLDIKDAGEVDTVLKIQKAYMQKAAAMGRQVQILFGLPADDIYKAYINSTHRTGSPAICELDISQVLESDAAAWGPRWTLGTLDAEVNQMHSQGRKAIVWTLDQPEFITKYIRDGYFDGILTNYPTLVAYHNYIRE